MPKNEELDAMLAFDPLDTAEKMLRGIGTQGDATMLGLGLSMKHNALKRAALEELDDTTFSNTMADTIRIVEREGFELLLTIPFMGKGFGDEPETPEEYRIYWHPELHALLTMESYGTEDLNTGKMHFAWKSDDPNRHWPDQCSGGCRGGDRVFVGDYDIREAFAYRLTRMEETGTFVKQWPETGFLWLLHWMDTKAEGYDYKAITAERMAQLPQHVRDAMAWNPSDQ